MHENRDFNILFFPSPFSCPRKLVTVQILSNNLHLVRTAVVVERWRMTRQGGISSGSSWLPAGLILQDDGDAKVAQTPPLPSYKQAGTRLRVLVVNLASFLAYIHHTVGCWRTRRTIRTEQLQMLHFTRLSFKWEIISFHCHSWSKLSLKYILDCW